MGVYWLVERGFNRLVEMGEEELYKSVGEEGV